MKIVSDLLAHRGLVVFKNEQPFDTGNWRHNASTISNMKPDGSHELQLRVEEARYIPQVLDLYKSRGDDILERSTIAVFNLYNMALNGGKPLYDRDYLMARRNVLFTSKDSEDRQYMNETYGSGRFGGSLNI